MYSPTSTYLQVRHDVQLWCRDTRTPIPPAGRKLLGELSAIILAETQVQNDAHRRTHKKN